ncbi:hypothetical protein ACJIZ3_010752 [Penstemon smallii]|uniref:Late embryogenesis abundant protein LEA-2 subgroup domain-containing protein n=1 Tax=Penstemon smallii TaxID=265156 RepID=A0ABD3UHG9_9LAMI
MLQQNPYGNNAHQPPYRRTIPRYQHKRSNGAKRCCRCICYCFCCILMLLVILSFLSFYFYIIYGPKIPSYKIENFEVKAFDVQLDFSLNAEFQVTVKAENPNSNIGFIYGKSSYVIVTYTDTNLCSGKLPNFHQGPLNTTLMKVDLKGKSEFGSGLQQAFTENRNSHRIPLLVRIKVPVRVVVGEIPLRQFDVFVNCSMLVDNLAPNKKIGIISSNTTFDYDLWG